MGMEVRVRPATTLKMIVASYDLIRLNRISTSTNSGTIKRDSEDCPHCKKIVNEGVKDNKLTKGSYGQVSQ